MRTGLYLGLPKPHHPSRNRFGNLIATIIENEASVSTSTDYIYEDDALNSGWADWSWDSVRDFDSTAQVRNGTSSVEVNYDQWGALQLRHNGYDTTGKTNFAFSLYGGASGIDSLFIRFVDEKSNSQGEIYLENEIGNIEANTWYDVSLPLSLWNAEATTTLGMFFQANQDVTLYFDDIGFQATSSSGTSTPSIRYVHTDHLGGTNVVTDENGDIVQVLDYYPYGSRRINSGTDTSQREFAGHEFDETTELSYMEARYYDGSSAKFLSQDQMFLGAGETNDPKKLGAYLSDPQNMNSYAYARNNPIVYHDPDGQFAFLIPILIMAAPIALAYAPYAPAFLHNWRDTLSFSPGVGDAISAKEAITGRSAFSGEQLTGLDRGLAGIGVLPLIPGFAGRFSQNAERVAKQISEGHAYNKHVLGINNVYGKEYGTLFESRGQFGEYIKNVLSSPSDMKNLSSGRAAFWDNRLGSVVIFDPKNIDLGTAFRPQEGKQFFDKLK